MDIAQILDELSTYEKLPVEAIRAAEADRAAVIPVFLQVIEDFLSASPDERAEPSPLFFIFHLLGSWREQSAYRPLARLLRCPDIDPLLGDATGENGHRVMAAVFDGDPQPLYDVILDPQADEYARSSMLDALAIVTLRGELSREETARFLAACFTDLKPETNCFAWHGWQAVIAALGLARLRPLVKEAFKRGSVETFWLRFDDFEEDLKAAIENPAVPALVERNSYTPFGDTIEELSMWGSFLEEPKEDRPRLSLNFGPSQAINPFRNVGRNDPCPCGSGKKFKKCCLNREAPAIFDERAA
jgi:hypothetical protein